MAPVVYLVSGASRGIGFALVQHLVGLDNVIVFAGVRDPVAAMPLNDLAARLTKPGKLHIIKLISADQTTNREAVEEIERIAGRLDVVIANAGIMKDNQFVLGPSLENMQEHFSVNVLGPLALIQATYPLLKTSTTAPKFVPISSTSGSIALGTQFPIPQTEYGTSKAALNWMTKKLWTENEGLITFPLSPGMVRTDMSTAATASPEAQAVLKQMGAQFMEPEEAARLIMQQIDTATRETNSFMNLTGEVIPW